MYQYTQNAPEQSAAIRKMHDSHTEIFEPMKKRIENAYSLPLEDVRIHYNVPDESGYAVRQMQGPLQQSTTKINQSSLSEGRSEIVESGSSRAENGIHSLQEGSTIQLVPKYPTIGDPFVRQFQGNGEHVIADNMVEIKLDVDGNQVKGISCRILFDAPSAVAATIKLAILLRHFYNCYLTMPYSAESEKALVVTYSIDMKNSVKQRVTAYSQEVVYSHAGEGYVTKEINDAKTTDLDQRQQLTGRVNDGALYTGAHTESGDWIASMENGTGTGDNGSKLTAERARFQLLMDDTGSISDNTYYIIRDNATADILLVNALDLTANFHTIWDFRRTQNVPEAELRLLPVLNQEIAGASRMAEWRPAPLILTNDVWTQISQESTALELGLVEEVIVADRMKKLESVLPLIREMHGRIEIRIGQESFLVEADIFVQKFPKLPYKGLLSTPISSVFDFLSKQVSFVQPLDFRKSRQTHQTSHELIQEAVKSQIFRGEDVRVVLAKGFQL